MRVGAFLQYAIDVDIEFLVVERDETSNIGAFQLSSSVPPNYVLRNGAVGQVDVVVAGYTLERQTLACVDIEKIR